MLAAIVTASASIIVAAATFFLAKSKERAADWRKVRMEQYRELVSAMSEVAGSPSATASQRLALASNHVGLFASGDVLRQLSALLTAIQSGQLERHDEMLTALMHSIRADLGVPGARGHRNIKFRLWAAGKGS